MLVISGILEQLVPMDVMELVIVIFVAPTLSDVLVVTHKSALVVVLDINGLIQLIVRLVKVVI